MCNLVPFMFRARSPASEQKTLSTNTTKKLVQCHNQFALLTMIERVIQILITLKK